MQEKVTAAWKMRTKIDSKAWYTTCSDRTNSYAWKYSKSSDDCYKLSQPKRNISLSIVRPNKKYKFLPWWVYIIIRWMIPMICAWVPRARPPASRPSAKRNSTPSKQVSVLQCLQYSTNNSKPKLKPWNLTHIRPFRSARGSSQLRQPSETSTDRNRNRLNKAKFFKIY